MVDPKCSGEQEEEMWKVYNNDNDDDEQLINCNQLRLSLNYHNETLIYCQKLKTMVLYQINQNY